MIKLLFFVPCEKLIIGQDNRTSLISVLEHLFLRGEISENLPANAGFPLQWSAVALWNRTEKIDSPIDFDSKAEVFTPDGTGIMDSEAQFTVSSEFLNYRNLFHFPIFPIGQEGIYKTTLSYKRRDSEDWQLAGEYPIQVIYKLTESKNEDSQQIEYGNGKEHPAKSV